MSYNNNDAYSRVNDAVYDKNLNNSIAVGGVLEMILNTQIPSRFSTGLFNNTETSQRVQFLDVNLVNNTATNNNSNITGVSGNGFTLECDVILSNFKSWNKVKFEGTGVNNLSITLKDKDNNTLRNIINGENLTEYIIDKTSLKIVVSFTGNCTINNIILGVNTRKYDNNNSIMLPTSQINGLDEWKTGIEEDINNISIATSNLQTGAVTENKIGTGAVTENKIGTGAVTENKIADNSVKTNKINDNAITTPKINNKAVTTAKINDNAVTQTQLANSSVGSENIIDNSIMNSDINSNALIALSKIEKDNITLLGSTTIAGLTVNQYGFNNNNLMLTTAKWRGSFATQTQDTILVNNLLPVASGAVLALWSSSQRSTGDIALANTNSNWLVNNNSKNATFRIYQGTNHTFAWDYFMLSAI